MHQKSGKENSIGLTHCMKVIHEPDGERRRKINTIILRITLNDGFAPHLTWVCVCVCVRVRMYMYVCDANSSNSSSNSSNTSLKGLLDNKIRFQIKAISVLASKLGRRLKSQPATH